jgi:predicted N-acyltransferase
MTSYSLDTTIQGPLRKFLLTFDRIFPNVIRLKTLMCGLPTGRGRVGIAGDPDRVMRAIYRAMEEQIAEKERVALIIFKDFEAVYEKDLACLADFGFYRFEGLPSTEMNLAFGDFEDYLKTLSYASRYDLRRKFRNVAKKPPLEFEAVSSISGKLLDEAHALYLQTVRRHELGFEVLPKEFFVNIAKRMPQEARFFLWRLHGKLVGFGFCLAAGDYFLDYYVGFDYSVAYEYSLFFVRFRDILNWCLTRGFKKYEMGYTSYEPKRRLGFAAVPLFIYIKHRNPWINRIMKPLCRMIRFENFDPSLRQMKKKHS